MSHHSLSRLCLFQLLDKLQTKVKGWPSPLGKMVPQSGAGTAEANAAGNADGGFALVSNSEDFYHGDITKATAEGGLIVCQPARSAFSSPSN